MELVELEVESNTQVAQYDNKHGVNPAEFYLRTLQSESSYYNMRSALNCVVSILGYQSYLDFPWLQLEHTKVLLIRNWFIEQLNEDGTPKYSPITINNYMAAVRGVCRSAWEMKLITNEVYERIKAIKPVKGSRIKERKKYSIAEIASIKESFLQYAKSKQPSIAFRNITLFTLISCSGIRREESVNLKVTDIIEASESIKVQGKGNKERIVPVQSDAFKILLYWVDQFVEDINGPVFTKISKTGTYGDKPLNKRSVNYIFDDIKIMLVEYAGFPEDAIFNPHNFRHSYATILREITEDISLIQSILGHSDIKTTVGYFIENQQATANLVSKLPSF